MSAAITMDTPKSEWWPHLGFVMVAGLDNVVTQYSEDVLRQIAHALEADTAHRTIAATSAALILEHLAETPAAIKEMNHRQKNVPGEILRMNRAVHYLVRLELLGKDAALDIATIWDVKEATIEHDRDDFKKGAVSIINTLVETAGRSRISVLEDIDADMVDPRAKRMRKR